MRGMGPKSPAVTVRQRLARAIKTKSARQRCGTPRSRHIRRVFGLTLFCRAYSSTSDQMAFVMVR